MRNIFLWIAALMALAAPAAERTFNFSDDPLDRTPPGFRSTVAGWGKAGDWKVIWDETPPALDPLMSRTSPGGGRAVLAQLARNASGSHFPLLLFQEETYGDFKFASRFKIVGGAFEQMAGLVFRFQNESNFYFVGASALGNTFQCSKVVNGELKPPIGPSLVISKGAWHELAVECEGTRIVCSFDGKEAIKLIDASGNHAGKIGFVTQADSVGYFTDAKVSYTRRESLAQKLVRDAMKEYPRLLDLKIYAVSPSGNEAAVVASKDAKDIGQPAGKTEQDVIGLGRIYFGKQRGSALVAVPLRDRNGDPIAAVCVVLKSFPGQTEDNAVARAQPVAQRIQARVTSLEDLLQ